jgi:uncharacterized protein (TIGR00255 family)
MIRSMTGFGAASVDLNGAHYVVEVRSLNSRYFKSVIRLPEELQALEAELESVLIRRLNRGSVVLTVRFADTSANAAAQINVKALQSYLQQLLDVPGMAHGAARIELGALLALPGVIQADTGEELLERVRPVLMKLVEETCEKVIAMRQREGRVLHEELHKHCTVIADRLSRVAQRVPLVVEQYQARLRQRMDALLADSGGAAKDEDLIREVAIFAERSDIAEEVARLQAHIKHFREIIDVGHSEPAGRTLDFLGQEMLREANTIGSKCMDAEISRAIVEIKGSIDRIKEQTQNIE